jgi:hypothetical protein
MPNKKEEPPLDPQELTEWVKSYKDSKPAVHFDYSWIEKLGRWISKLEESFHDPEKIKGLTFEQQMRLYDRLTRNLDRIFKFLLKLKSSLPQAFEEGAYGFKEGLLLG